MEIRSLKTEELDLHFQLSEFAFQYELTGEELEVARKRVAPENIWGAFVEGKLASKMAILPLEAYIHGKPYSMGGVASVATWPEYRRQGLVAKLLTHGLEVMKDKGQVLSFLAPFSYPFYRKYGWEMHGEYKEWKIKVDLFPKLIGKGSIYRSSKEDTTLHQLYDQFAQRFNGMLKRDSAWWENRVFTGSRKKSVVAIYRDAQAQAKGYLLYEVREDKFRVHEMVYLDQDSYCGLWQFIAQHDSMIEEVQIKTHRDDPLPLLLANPRIEQKLVPYFMVRLVDVKAFLEEYPLNWTDAGQQEHTFLHISDAQAPWNDGTFHIQQAERSNAEGENGSASVRNQVTFYPRRQEELSCTNPPRKGLSCDIQTLSSMLLGYQRPGLLHRLEKIKGEAAEVKRWERLLPQAETYLMDFF